MTHSEHCAIDGGDYYLDGTCTCDLADRLRALATRLAAALVLAIREHEKVVDGEWGDFDDGIEAHTFQKQPEVRAALAAARESGVLK